MRRVKMNEKVKKLWVAHLRKNAHRQTTEVLKRRNKSICALGSLCEVAARYKIVKQKYDKKIGYYSFDRAFTAVPHKVIHWSGFYNQTLRLKNGTYEQISSINDSGMYDFYDIAGMIEKQL